MERDLTKTNQALSRGEHNYQVFSDRLDVNEGLASPTIRKIGGRIGGEGISRPTRTPGEDRTSQEEEGN